MHKLTFALLWLVVFFIPFEEMMNLGELPSANRLLGALVLGAGLCAVLSGATWKRVPAALLLMTGFFLWLTFSLAWTGHVENTQTQIGRGLSLLAFTWLLWLFCSSYAQQAWMLRAFIYGHVVPLGMMYWTFLLHRGLGEPERYSGGRMNPNFLANLLVLAILAAAYLASNPQKGSRTLRLLYWGFVLVAVVGVLLTGSRAGLVALFVGGLWVMWLCGYRSWKAIALYFVAGICVYLVTQYGIHSEALGHMSRQEMLEDDPRWNLWRHGLASIPNHPLLGVGAGAFGRVVMGDLRERTVASHNAAITILAELGIVGFALYSAFFALVIRAAWRLPARERTLWLGMLPVWLIGELSGGTGLNKSGWFIFGMVLAQSATFRGRPSAGAQPTNARSPSPARVPPRGTACNRPLRPRFGGLSFLLWGSGAPAIAFPKCTIWIASRLGIGRGADLMLYFSLLAGMAAGFYFHQRCRHLENLLTEPARREAIARAEKGPILGSATENSGSS